LYFLCGVFVASRLMNASDHGSHAAGIVLMSSGVALLVLLFVALFRLILIPRIRDLGLEPAWAWSLLFFVHAVTGLFLFVLLVAPTNAFAKRSYAEHF